MGNIGMVADLLLHLIVILYAHVGHDLTAAFVCEDTY